MKLSIFPAANPHPKGKEEKHTEAYNFSAPNYPETVEIADDEQLAHFVTNFAWSPFVFSGYRREENFVSTDFLTYDIDYGMTIAECEKLIDEAKLCCLCLPSPSHTDEAQRFRVILPLARTITNLEVYAETWKKGAAILKVADEQCKDGCRGYFGSTKTDGFWTEGELFVPVQIAEKSQTLERSSQGAMINVDGTIEDFVTSLYGEKRDRIPEAVDFFIRNAHTGLPGSWVNRLNAAAFSLALSGVDESTIIEAFEELAPEPLDKRDIFQIKRSARDGLKNRGE